MQISRGAGRLYVLGSTTLQFLLGAVVASAQSRAETDVTVSAVGHFGLATTTGADDKAIGGGVRVGYEGSLGKPWWARLEVQYLAVGVHLVAPSWPTGRFYEFADRWSVRGLIAQPQIPTTAQRFFSVYGGAEWANTNFTAVNSEIRVGSSGALIGGLNLYVPSIPFARGFVEGVCDVWPTRHPALQLGITLTARHLLFEAPKDSTANGARR